MAEFLQNILVIASFFGVLYAPFHYLDRFASAEARAKARSAIRAGQSHIDVNPLVTLLDAVFGARHFTVRCFLLSCIMSLVFQLLSLGAVNAYADLVDHIERREERRADAERALNEANAKLLEAVNDIIKAIGSDQTPKGQRAREEMEKRRAEIESMLKNPLPTLPSVLLWMLASVLVSLNFLCDYVALGKTRLILRQINKATSKLAISAYLLLDLLLAGVIWLTSIAAFVLINRDTFLIWANEEPFLVSAVGIVSLWTTIATSIWIYTYLLGGFISTNVRRLVRLSLNSVTALIDPYEHPFKIIGVLGSTTVAALTLLAFLLLHLL